MLFRSGKLNDVTSLNLFKDNNTSNDEDFTFGFYREKGTEIKFGFYFIVNEKEIFCVNYNSSDFTSYAAFLTNYFKDLKNKFADIIQDYRVLHIFQEHKHVGFPE